MYQIRLLKLDPYPEIIDQTILQEDYQATFVINSSNPLTATAEPTASSTPGGPFIGIVETGDKPPVEAESEYHKGLTYLAAGLTEEAIASLTKAITLYPTYAEAYQYRGDAYRLLRCYDLARTDYRQVLALNPTVVLLLSCGWGFCVWFFMVGAGIWLCEYNISD